MEDEKKMSDDVLAILSDPTLTYDQQIIALARYAENLNHTIPLSKEYIEAKKEGILCDLNEGAAPYRPRYICPDYAKLMKEGSKFLDLKPAKNLDEALTNLLIFYRYVPSVTTFPVYLGDLDDLLEPFVLEAGREHAKESLRLFLLQIDRTLNDSFVHADIGPQASLTGELLMELSEEMQCAIPNLTIKYDPDITPRDFALKGIKTMLKVAKPSFANDKLFRKEWGDNYAIASCYNGLLVKGGGFTLPRLRMYECAKKASSVDDFLNNVLPHYANIMMENMDNRIDFLVNKSNFFKANFLVKEDFVELDNFVGMFGMVGLAEGVNTLLGITDKKQGFGNNPEAEQLGLKIMDTLESIVAKHHAPYGYHHEYRLHAQVGINTDGKEDSPGARIPVGVEPTMPQQLLCNIMFQKYFPTGAGDIFKFEETWEKTPEALLEILNGAIRSGLRYFSGYLQNNDVVRVTGYLVKKSELAKLDQGKQSINNCTLFGQGARDCGDALDRRIVHESDCADK